MRWLERILLAVVCVLVFAFFAFSAPVPKPKERKEEPPLTAVDVVGHWKIKNRYSVSFGGDPDWHMVLWSDGRYGATSSARQASFGEWDYVGTWSLDGGTFTIKEWNKNSGPWSQPHTYTVTPKRAKGGGIDGGETTFLAGRWSKE